MRTTLRGGLAPDVRPGRCVYCGRPCNGRTCAAHVDLPAIEAVPRDCPCLSMFKAVAYCSDCPYAVDRSVETVDRPNGLRSESAT